MCRPKIFTGGMSWVDWSGRTSGTCKGDRVSCCKIVILVGEKQTNKYGNESSSNITTELRYDRK